VEFLVRTDDVRIPMLEVTLALGHFYLNDVFRTNCVYKLILPFTNSSPSGEGNYVSSMTWRPCTSHIAKKRTLTSWVLFLIHFAANKTFGTHMGKSAYLINSHSCQMSRREF
jgi:hypothetical protein